MEEEAEEEEEEEEEGVGGVLLFNVHRLVITRKAHEGVGDTLPAAIQHTDVIQQIFVG